MFESRFLPKALLTFVVADALAVAVAATVADAARSGNERRRPGLVRTRTARHLTARAIPLEDGAKACMSNADLLIAANTLWVVVAAVLVMFMQAGFAFLEAGLTRMKNAAHIAGKNVLIFGVCSLVYWAVGFGIAFGDGNRSIGTSGFAPSVDSLLAVGQAPYSFFTTVPGAAGYLFEVVFAGVSLAIVWGAMAERAKLWVYFVFGAGFTLIYSVTSHWVWGGGWLFGLGMQDFAGSTVVHYQGALAALAGALLLGPRIGKFDGGRGERDPRPQHPVRRARDADPLVRLVRLQPGLDARRRHRRQGRLLRLRRADDEPRGRGGSGQRRAHRLARAAASRTSR